MTVYSVVQGGVVNAADVSQFVQLLTGSMTDQPVTVSNRIRAALSGANAGSGGFAGATAGFGAPTTGTFNTGDFVIDGTGVLWYCTTGGTPGTWRQETPYRQTQTLGSTTAQVTFGSIPSTLRTLKLLIQARTTTVATFDNVDLRINGNATVGDYRWASRYVINAGAQNQAQNLSDSKLLIGGVAGASAGGSQFGTVETTLTGWNGTAGMVSAMSHAGYVDTAGSLVNDVIGEYFPLGPYTSIALFPDGGGSFAANSQFMLLGWA